MRKRAFDLTGKQRRLIEQMLADPAADVHVAAGRLAPKVRPTRLIAWMQAPEFAAALAQARAVQRQMLQQRAMVRELGGRGEEDAGTPRRRDALAGGEPAFGGGTGRPAADGARAAPLDSAAPTNAAPRILTAEEYDAIYREATEGEG